ncbi:hypothetical protein ACJ73_05601 [Blastomyces percursus]|uniref:Uncharacterized protein n=1 Tax=Blastomyces percursus TaxID=1658174 RepID=A0A1J9QS49_9EURO|nr:hypothetical protein ACJ73_05601 [Blastomyces percursus]
MYCGVPEGGPRHGRRPKATPPSLSPSQASGGTDGRNNRPNEISLDGWDDALRATPATRRGLGVVLSVSRTPGRRTAGASINTHVART